MKQSKKTTQQMALDWGLTEDDPIGWQSGYLVH